MADNPISREEMFLASAAGEYSGKLPEPITREEKYLKAIAENGGGEFNPDEYYTKDETDYEITEKVAEIVADAPEDFDTLKEMSDWIDSHEDSAAAMNSAIRANTTAITGKVDKEAGKGLSTEDYTTAEKTKLSGIADNATYIGKLYPNSTYGEIFNDYVANKASGRYSHAEGNNCTASGNFSHAEGGSSVASGEFSHTSGWRTIAKSTAQTAIGKYNVINDNDTYAFIIGNGSDNARSNAFAVDWNGLIYIGNSATGINLNTLVSGMNNKVDKITGKGLSTNDYTNAEKTKLAGLSNYNDTALQTAVANKVDKVSGKGLSTEDYTTAEKTKLSGIEAGANNITVDSALSSSSTNPVQNKAVNSALSNKIPKSGDTSLSGTFEPQQNYGANLGSSSYRFDKIYAKDLYLTNALSVANGGTGCTTLSDFKTALGLGNSAYKDYTTSVISGSTDLITSGAVYSGLANYIPLAGSSAITGDLVPSTSDSVDLGSSSKRWDNLYAKNVSAESFSINVRTYDCDAAIESGHYIFYGSGRTSNLPSTAGDSEYGILVVYRSGDYCIQTVYMLGKKTAHIRYTNNVNSNPFTSWVQIFSFSS